MKKFEEAMMDIVCFEAEDVISTSGNETPEVGFIESNLDIGNGGTTSDNGIIEAD